jgi:hypothetical protein
VVVQDADVVPACIADRRPAVGVPGEPSRVLGERPPVVLDNDWPGREGQIDLRDELSGRRDVGVDVRLRESPAYEEEARVRLSR